jgi:hypothetical protein
MTAPDRPLGDDAVERLVNLAREAPPEHLTAGEWAGLQRLESALLVGPKRRRAPSWTFAIAAVALAGAALVLALRLRDRALTYEVTNATVSDGGYISTGDAEASVRFSDRSELGVERGTRLRVSRLEVRGARVMLEGGMLHVRIRPEPHAAWTLDAGPYVVRVTGTEFDLAWRVDDQTLDLRLRKGSVVVEGPLADAGLKVGAGQHLVANANTGTLSLVDELNASPSSSAVPSSSLAAMPSEGPASLAAVAATDVPALSETHDAGASWRGRSATSMVSWQTRTAGASTRHWPSRRWSISRRLRTRRDMRGVKTLPGAP